MLYPLLFYIRRYFVPLELPVVLRDRGDGDWNGEKFGYRILPKYDKAKLLRAALDLYGGPAILFVISTFILRYLCHISYLLTISTTVSRYSTEYYLIFVIFISVLDYIICNHSYYNINTFTVVSKQDRKCKSKVRIWHVRVIFIPLGYQKTLHNFTTRQRYSYSDWMSRATQKVRRSLCKVPVF
jgi:hypothetical protein